jgi:hypothetical protein
MPESFKCLSRDSSLCLDVRVHDAAGDEIELKDDDEDTSSPARWATIYIPETRAVREGGFDIETRTANLSTD